MNGGYFGTTKTHYLLPEYFGLLLNWYLSPLMHEVVSSNPGKSDKCLFHNTFDIILDITDIGVERRTYLQGVFDSPPKTDRVKFYTLC